MSARNRFLILLGIIFVIAASYYFFSVDHSKDLVLIGTVDANQVHYRELTLVGAAGSTPATRGNTAPRWPGARVWKT